jgi:hypothetical protein
MEQEIVTSRNMDRQPTTDPAMFSHVQEVLRTAREELSDLMRQRAETMKRIGTIKQTLAGLADLFGESILNDELLLALDRRVSDKRSGFTQICRQILVEAQLPLGVRKFCEELWRRSPDLARRHKDLGASVNTVLHRLVAYEEARCFLDQRGVKVWEWVADGARQPTNSIEASGAAQPGLQVTAADPLTVSNPSLLPTHQLPG